MAKALILNNKFQANYTTGALPNWTNGTNGAWANTGTQPQNNAVYGNYFVSGDNGLSQTGVFPDYTAGTVSHTIKVVVNNILSTGRATVLFGTTTAGTITTIGTYYFTGIAAGNSKLTFNVTQGLVGIESVYNTTELEVTSLTGSASTYINPVYNSINFNVQSSQTAQPNYKYVFDIYTGHSTSTSVARIKLLPRPGLANCLFSPARILESSLTYSKNVQTITAATSSSNTIIPYQIGFGEEYGLLETGITIHSGLQFFSGYTFNSVLNYEQVPYWSYMPTLFFPSQVPIKPFLTNSPSAGTYVQNATDVGTLSFMQVFSACTTQQVVVYHNSGGTSVYWAHIGGVNADGIVHIPSGIWNLNNSSFYTGGTTPIININTDYKYTVQVGYTYVEPPTIFAAMSLTHTFLISECTKYSTVRFMFLNRWGCWDYFNFNLVSRKTVNAKRDVYRKVLNWNYAVGDRGETVLDIDANYTYKVNSDWINDDESTWLQEIMTSPEVYVINSDRTVSPVVIDDSTYEIKKSINDKLFNISFSYHDAVKINNQRS